MAIRIPSTGGTLIQPSRIAPSYPFWQRAWLRYDSNGDGGWVFRLTNPAGTVSMGLLAVNNTAIFALVTTSWGSAAAQPLGLGTGNFAAMMPVLLEWASAASVRVSWPANAAGTVCDVSNPNASELSGISRFVVGEPGLSRPNFSVAEYFDGTGTLTSEQRTALLTNVAVESVSGLTITSAATFNPAGAAGDDVPDSIASLVGDPFAASANLVVSSTTHPVTRSAPAPVLSAPTAGTPGTTTITISATSDRASDGTMYFLRRVGGSAASAATIVSTGESQAATGNPQSRGMTGFAAGSTNNIVDMVQAGAGGNSNVVSTSAFTMASAAATIAPISCPSHASQSGFSGAVLSAAAPGTGVTVISTFTGLSFNGAGNASVSMVGLGLSPGTVRYVIGTQSDGSLAPGTNPRCFQGPVELT